MQVPPHNYFLILSVLAGISVYFQSSSPRYLKLFPVYLLLTVFVEFFGYWLAARTGNNFVLYNFYNIVQFSFYLFVMKEVIVNEKIRKVIPHVIWVFVLYALVNMFFIQKINSWNSITYSIGSLITVPFVIYYFFEIFKRPKATDLKREPAFWICSGLLFFLSCSFPFFGFVNFLQKSPHIIIKNLQLILTMLNILLYLLFTIAFLCRIRISGSRQRPVL